MGGPSKAKKQRAAQAHVPVKRAEIAKIIAELEAEETGVVADLEASHIQVVGEADSDARWAVYLSNLERGSRIGAAAKAAGIPYGAICRRRAVDEDFVKAERMAEMEASEAVENAMWKAATNGESWAVLAWLQNRAPDRWRDSRRPDRQILHVEGDIRHVLDANTSMDRVGELLDRIDQRKRAKELGGAGFIDVDPLPDDEV